MTKLGKAVIPAAGFGDTLPPKLPKTLAKEMLPIVDKPTIQFIVEEALKSGIEEILVVTGKAKRSIEDHFDSNFELEYNLEQKGKTDLLKLVNDTTAINLSFHPPKSPSRFRRRCSAGESFCWERAFCCHVGR